MRKEGYESVPDVEQGGGGDNGVKLSAKEKYPDLIDEKQIELMDMMDDAVDKMSTIEVRVPKMIPPEDELKTNCIELSHAMIIPTITCLCTALLALYLNPYQNIISDISKQETSSSSSSSSSITTTSLFPSLLSSSSSSSSNNIVDNVVVDDHNNNVRRILIEIDEERMRRRRMLLTDVNDDDTKDDDVTVVTSTLVNDTTIDTAKDDVATTFVNNTVVDTVTDTVAALYNDTTSVLNNTATIVHNVQDAATTKLNGTIASVNTDIDEAKSFFNNTLANATAAYDAAKDKATSFVNNTVANATAAYDAVQDKASSFINGTLTNATAAYDAAKDKASSFINGTLANATAAYDVAKDKASSLINGTLANATAAYDAAKDKASSFMNGTLTNATEYFKEKAEKLNDVKEKAESLLNSTYSNVTGYLNDTGALIDEAKDKAASYLNSTFGHYGDLVNSKLNNTYDNVFNSATSTLGINTSSSSSFITNFTSNPQEAVEGAAYSAWEKLMGYFAIFFPYFNAIVVFISSIKPMKKRTMDKIGPLYVMVDDTSKKIKSNVDNITKNVDSTVDGIQSKTNDVIEPMKPNIDQASSQLNMLRTIDPDIDIPDTDDINAQFDNMQGIVGSKVDEAKKFIRLDQYIPEPIRSVNLFYWRIVFPAMCMMLALQLLVAYITARHGGSTTTQVVETSTAETTRRYLMELNIDAAYVSSIDLVPNAEHIIIDDPDLPPRDLLEEEEDLLLLEEEEDDISLLAADASELLDNSTLFDDDAHDKFDQYKDNLTSFADSAHDKFDEYKENATAFAANAHDQFDQYKDNATAFAASAHEKFDQYKDNITANFDQFKSLSNVSSLVDVTSYEDKFEEATEESKSLIWNVITSFFMAIAQLLLVFVFTSETVKAYLFNKTTTKATDDVNRKLREHGVTTVLEDIFITKIGTLRDKLLKLFNIYGKIMTLLEKINSGIGMIADKLPGDMGKKLTGAVEDVSDKMKDVGSNVKDVASNMGSKMKNLGGNIKKPRGFGGFGR